MFQMVPLQFAPISRQVPMMQKVVRHVIAHVPEDTAAEDGLRGEEVVEEDRVREVPERRREGEEQRRRHDEPQPVHGQIVVDAVQEEVRCQRDSVVREVGVDVEEAPMQDVLHERPDAEAEDPVGGEGGRRERLARVPGPVGNARQPDARHDPPRGLAEGLEEVAEERRGVAPFVVPRAVHLREVELLAEAAVPDLHQHRPVEIDEFVGFVVGAGVGFDG